MLPVSIVSSDPGLAPIIGFYYLAFFDANSLIGCVGGLYQMLPTTTFRLLQAGFAAAGAVFCFAGLKFVASHHLETEAR
jgi:POT family proton-dependent oligopeptide transporter